MATLLEPRAGSEAAHPYEPLEDVADIVPCLLDALQERDLVFLARDEPRAVEIAAALAAAGGPAVVLLVPGSDALPGDGAPPTPANVGQRTSALRTLRAALAGKDCPRVAVVSSGEAAGRLYAPPSAFTAAPPTIATGDTIDLATFAAQLEEIGYTADERVDEPGELALRGQVLDVFPADAGEPFRIEVQDERIVAIRAYDPATQRTTAECERLELGHATEPEIGDGVSLVDHAPHAAVVLDRGADKRRRNFLQLAAETGRRAGASQRDVCPEDRWQAALAGRDLLALGEDIGEAPPRFVESRDPVRASARLIRTVLDDGGKLLLLGTARDLRFLCRRVSRGLRREPQAAASWGEVLAAPAGSLLALEMSLPRGFRYRDIVAIAAADLLGSRAERDGSRAAASDLTLFQFGEVRVGDVVVHEDHGLATVAGLEPIEGQGDAIVLRFAGETRRLVPVAEAGRIWRYGAEEAAVRLDTLDGSSWEKRRSELDAALAETARGLVALAAERLEQTAPVLEPDPAAYEKFAAGFPFSETADQARAIAAVRADLASGKPMDRLVVGDVGFGKTEVALRAAALTALAGKQVALAAPTTVLARQHLETFRDRFEGTGIEVAGLSRLSSAAEKKAVKAGLADGSVRVVIGTGAVAGKGVAYADLALVIVDEEQRFGAADKAHLRELGAGDALSHLLTLSATPIPRTLQSALVGLRQLSTIATPPARRQPIRTVVRAFDEQAVRTALLRERSRGGQSFLVVPRIEDMAPMAERLGKLVPELKTVAAHGKMAPSEIDETMVRYAAGQGDVLLATNIIEAGLDVPRANTMIVWKADRFGLAQLHQLRGRVGRGARRGQVLLLTEEGVEIAPRTMARLNTLAAFDRLGAGFAISARDLDLRGAGDLLGDEQAGHVKLIGVELYQHLLEQAIRGARGEAADAWIPAVNLGADGCLPEAWIPDIDLRIGLYTRLARVTDLPALEALEEELIDRFGEMPDEARSLLVDARLRVLARQAGIERVDAGPAAIALTPRAGVALAGNALGLEAKNGRHLLRGRFGDVAERIEQAEELLASLAGNG